MKKIGIAVNVCLMLCLSSASGARFYVSSTATSNCSSWSTACSLATAIANADNGQPDEIWVKQGTYNAASSGTFYLGSGHDGDVLIGGFQGTETLASQSRPGTFKTYLDGGGTTRVLGIESAEDVVVRGFHIRNGYDADEGGGLLVYASDVLIVDCVFENNVANFFGGAVAFRDATFVPTMSVVVMNCIFKNNGTDNGTTAPQLPQLPHEAYDDHPYGGGALYLQTGHVAFTNCLFHGNKAWEGGALLTVFATSLFTNCTFVDNRATLRGGGAVFDGTGTTVLQNSGNKGTGTHNGGCPSMWRIA